MNYNMRAGISVANNSEWRAFGKLVTDQCGVDPRFNSWIYQDMAAESGDARYARPAAAGILLAGNSLNFFFRGVELSTSVAK